MKRSLIQESIEWAKALLEEYRISLPAFGYWSADDWKTKASEIDTIRKTMLGWDVTDYGNDKFFDIGTVLFTLRNGMLDGSNTGTPYAEKLILVHPGQRLPIHMHKGKTEDIISRAGGAYEIKLWNSDTDEQPDPNTVVEVYSDGTRLTVQPGEVLRIENGQSLTLTPYLYHSFWGAKDAAPAIIGEVSSINDDNTDNYFAEEVRRFSMIDEDAAQTYILCNEYDNLFK